MMDNIIRSFKVFLNTRSSKCVPQTSNYYGSVVFNFDSKIELINKESNMFSISVSDMIIPISWYMISSYFANNKIYLAMNSINYAVVIPDGSYTAIELRNILLTILPNAFTISYSAYYNTYTFTNSTYNFTFTNILCYQELGFYANTSYISSSKILTSIKVLIYQVQEKFILYLIY